MLCSRATPVKKVLGDTTNRRPDQCMKGALHIRPVVTGDKSMALVDCDLSCKQIAKRAIT